MNFKDLFNNFFDHNGKPTPKPEPGNQYRPSKNALLAASKAIHTLGLIDTSFGLKIWLEPKHRESWIWDLAIKHHFNNLKSVSLQLMDQGKKVICESTVEFSSQGGAIMPGAPRGVEIPIINRKNVASHRVVVVNIQVDESQYSHLQKLKWSEAESLARLPGSDFTTTHSRKTGGRQTGHVHLASHLRQTLSITRPIGPRGFGFATCESLGLSGIFFQSIHADRAVAHLATGKKITAVLVQTIDGLQARDIKAA